MNSLIPFFLLPFLVRKLGPEAYGQIGVFVSLMSMAAIVIGCGSVSYVRDKYFKLSEDELRRAIAIALIVPALLSVACLVLVGLYWLAFAGSTILPLHIMFGVVLAASASVIFNIRLALIQMAEKPLKFGAQVVILTLMNVALTILLVFVFDMGWEGRVAAVVAASSLMAVVSLVVLVCGDGVALDEGLKGARGLLSHGLPLVPHALMSPLIVFCERTALGENAGGNAVGVYFAAFQLALPMAMVASSLNLAIKPWGYKKMVAGEHAVVVRGSYIAMLGLMVLALAYACVLEVLFVPIVGEALAEGLRPAQWLAISGGLSGCYLVVAKGILIAGKTVKLMRITVTLGMACCVMTFFISDIVHMALLNCAHAVAVLILVWRCSNQVYPLPWFVKLTKFQILK